MNLHDRYAEVHSYSFDDDNPYDNVKIRLQTNSGQMDIDAEDFRVLEKAIQLFKLGETI
jgi:hypothetical protein